MRPLLGFCVVATLLVPGCGGSDDTNGSGTPPAGPDGTTELRVAWGRPGGGFDIGDPVDLGEADLWLGVGNFDGKPGIDVVAGNGDPHVVFVSGDGARGFMVGETHEFQTHDSGTDAEDSLRLLGAGENLLFGTEHYFYERVVLLDLTDDKTTLVPVGEANMWVGTGVVVHVDDDDLPDLVLGGCHYPGQGTDFPRHIQVYFGSADGLEEGPCNVYASCEGTHEFGMVAEDMDQDGRVDLVLATPSAGDPMDPEEPDSVRVLLGDGQGGFVEVARVEMENLRREIAVGDVTGDGWPDVVVAAPSMRVLAGVGDGTLAPPGPSQGEARLESSRAWDADADGDLDLLVRGDGYSLAIWKNDGTGSFTEHEEIDLSGRWGQSCEVADLDQDGILDIAFLTYVTEGPLW